MDTALILVKNVDEEKVMSEDEIVELLDYSHIASQLTASFENKPLYGVWRIIALSQIPYANKLDYTKKVVGYIEKNLATNSGFTLSGKETDLLPCYNVMIIEALSKLGYANDESVRNAVEWIKKYQPLKREVDVSWKGNAIKKYGGCLKSTPCYIGVAKTVKALIHYNHAIQNRDDEIESLIKKGMDYVLQHELFKRLSSKEPINKHILDLAFPASYQLNIVELLEIAYLTGNIEHENCKSAIDYVIDKRVKNSYWKINHAYKANGYVSFDKRGQKGEWLTYYLEKYLHNFI